MGGTVAIIDSTTFKVVNKIGFEIPGVRPELIAPIGIRFSTDGKQAYIALGRANRIAVVDVGTHKATSYILVGQRPWHIEISPGWLAALFGERTYQRHHRDRPRHAEGRALGTCRAFAVGDCAQTLELCYLYELGVTLQRCMIDFATPQQAVKRTQGAPMKILLVDDHLVVREGVRRLLAGIAGTELVEAASAETAIEFFRQQRPELVILDLNLPGSAALELLRRLFAEDEAVRVVVFSMHSELLYAVRALRLGARGYVSKSAGADELVTAVKKVAAGGRYVEHSLADELAFSQISSDDDPIRQLTTREVEILRLLGDGNSLTEIASSIGVAYKTVANACSALKSKLGVERTADLIRVSIELRQ